MCIKQSSLSAHSWECAPASVLCMPANGLGLNILVNSNCKGFGQSKRERKKNCCLISLDMNITIHDTHCIKVGSFIVNALYSYLTNWISLTVKMKKTKIGRINSWRQFCNSYYEIKTVGLRIFILSPFYSWKMALEKFSGSCQKL